MKRTKGASNLGRVAMFVCVVIGIVFVLWSLGAALNPAKKGNSKSVLENQIAPSSNPVQVLKQTSSPLIQEPNTIDKNSLYRFTVRDADGATVSMSSFQDKVLLVVNVASFCGYTDVNYKELVLLDSQLKDRGLRILAFPCNQFRQQEPKTPKEIVEFAKTQYGAQFQIFDKIDVNGPGAHPMYVEMKKEAQVPAIDWNFAKFLINKKGKVVRAYPSHVSPLKIRDDIEKEL
eukprot:PhF_6_TR17401/c0_g1_i1/m.26638/K00432/gpx; glutathione peroxidase